MFPFIEVLICIFLRLIPPTRFLHLLYLIDNLIDFVILERLFFPWFLIGPYHDIWILIWFLLFFASLCLNFEPFIKFSLSLQLLFFNLALLCLFPLLISLHLFLQLLAVLSQLLLFGSLTWWIIIIQESASKVASKWFLSIEMSWDVIIKFIKKGFIF